MPFDIRIVSTYPPKKCGIGTFSRDLATVLGSFMGEIGSVRVAAIDNDDGPYAIPVDLTIEQYNPKSWQRAASIILTRAHEVTNRTVVLLQHEYGLDPGEKGNTHKGNNFVNMARIFQHGGLMTLTYLHTVPGSPNDHQRRIIQDLAKYSDSLIVTTRSAIDILVSDTYQIDSGKIKHIDHGIRMHNPSQRGRLSIKKEYGLEDKLLITTLGLHSARKGIEFSIRAYTRFLNESCTEKQRKNIVYLIAGHCHPDRRAQEYQAVINKTLIESKLRCCEAKELGSIAFRKHDIVFLDRFLDEKTFLKLYTATNIMILPYLNMDQISSGILADTFGSGRVAITTKFMYALELINPRNPNQKGIIIDAHAKGILVDPGVPSVDQIAQGIDYLVFNREERLGMENRARIRGHEMRWDNSAWRLIQHLEFLRERIERVTRRGPVFKREKEGSIYEEKNSQLLNIE